MARPFGTIDLTPELCDKICTALRAGNYIETASAYVGITKDTFYRWLKRGAHAADTNDTSKLEAPYRAFHGAVREAIAVAEIRDVALIAKAATDQWTAAAWRLERRYPDRWGRRERHELSAPGGGPIQHAAIDPDKLAEKIAAGSAATTLADSTSADDALDEPSGIGDDSKIT